jgi:hypothetical protein
VPEPEPRFCRFTGRGRFGGDEDSGSKGGSRDGAERLDPAMEQDFIVGRVGEAEMPFRGDEPRESIFDRVELFRIVVCISKTRISD